MTENHATGERSIPETPMPERKTPIDVRNRPTLRKGRITKSKRVRHRIRAAGALRGAIESQEARVAAGYRRRFADELRDGEEMPDQILALKLASRSVMRAVEELSRADNVYCGQCIRRSDLNVACINVTREEIYPELVDVRRSIDNKFGRRNARLYHRIEGRTRRKPLALYPQLDRLMGVLRDPELAMPKPVRPGAKIDRQAWLARLEPGYLKLTAMLKQLAEEEEREKLLRGDRDYELESFDAVYSEALAFVRSVFCLAGVPEREIWHLLPTVQRRRLRGKARQERDARAEGRRESPKSERRTSAATGQISQNRH